MCFLKNSFLPSLDVLQWVSWLHNQHGDRNLPSLPVHFRLKYFFQDKESLEHKLVHLTTNLDMDCISHCAAKGICHINLLIAVCVTLSETMSHSLDTRSHHGAVHLPTDSTLAMPHTGGTVHTRVGTMSTTRLYPPSWPGSGWDSTGTKLLSRDVRGGDDHLREAGRRSNRLFRGVEGINGKAAVWRRRPSFLFRD